MSSIGKCTRTHLPPNRRRGWRGGASALALTIATPLSPLAAHAQTTAEPDSYSRLEEIIVTAQRREENLQKVPVSVTAITAAALTRSNITDTAGLQQVTPGLTWTVANRTALPYIRGIGSPDISVGSENSVAMYVDGIYIESSPGAMLQLNNIERVEVLKGPQGTLFGRNATGGLVQVITKQPSSTFGGSLEAGYGSFDTFTAGVYVTGPVTKNIAADFAAIYSAQGEGWGRNVFLNKEIDKQDVYSGRTKWLFDFDATKVILAADYTRQKSDISSERNIVAGAFGPGRTPSLPGYYDSQSQVDPTGFLKTGGVSLHAEHDFGFAKFSSITSGRNTRFTSLLDVDETPLAVLLLNFNTKVKAITQEFQLTSSGSGPLSWTTGLFYMHRDGYQAPWTVSGLAVQNPVILGRNILVNGVKSDVIAPYAQGTLALGSATKLTAGVRYTVEDQHYKGLQYNALGRLLTTADSSRTYRRPTFRLALNRDLSDNLMAYVSYNRGFKSGVYNVASINDPPANPETVDAYEVGLKSDLMDGKLRINLAAFRYDYADIQLSVPLGPSAITINAARARIQGLEVAVQAVPIDGLTLGFGLSYMPTAKYTRFPSAPLFFPLPAGGNGLTNFDNTGGRMIRAPEVTATASASYTRPLGGGNFDIGADVYYSDSFYWNVDRAVEQKAYAIANGQVGYTLNNGIRLSVWGKNLFDKKYMSGASETTAANVYSPASPRTVGAKVGYKF